MKRGIALVPALVLAAAAGCGGGGDSGHVTVSVFRSLGSQQCTGGGTTTDALRNALINAGVQVVAATCGTDRSAQPGVCGAPDGKIGVFDIPQQHQGLAQQLGFALLESVPGASKLPC